MAGVIGRSGRSAGHNVKGGSICNTLKINETLIFLKYVTQRQGDEKRLPIYAKQYGEALINRKGRWIQIGDKCFNGFSVDDCIRILGEDVFNGLKIKYLD